MSVQPPASPDYIPGVVSNQEPPMSPLLDLAERCERATGPDRELDCLIFESQHLLLMPIHRGTIDHEPTGEYFSWDGNRLPESAPRYTGSIDAAMTLVPEKTRKNGEPQEAYPRVLRFSKTEWHANIGYGNSAIGTNGRAATPPLALCAAALRARSTDTGGK